jgi:integrase
VTVSLFLSCVQHAVYRSVDTRLEPLRVRVQDRKLVTVDSEAEIRTGRLDRHLDPASVYWNIVRKYGLETGISAEVNGLCVHSLRATAATNALSHDSDIAKVQDWLGHANVSTTRLYDRRKSKPEDSPTFRVKY